MEGLSAFGAEGERLAEGPVGFKLTVGDTGDLVGEAGGLANELTMGVMGVPDGLSI